MPESVNLSDSAHSLISCAFVAFLIVACAAGGSPEIDRAKKPATENYTDKIKADIGQISYDGQSLVAIDEGNIKQYSLRIATPPLIDLNPTKVTNSSENVGHDVERMYAQRNGAMWLAGRSNLSRWHPDDGLCTVTERLRDIDVVSRELEAGSILVNETFYLDGKGVVGQQFTITEECIATPGTVEQPATTTIIEANTHGISFQAKSALIAAGPRRQRAPVIEQWREDQLIKRTTVLNDQSDANKIVDMLVTDDRLLLLAQTGAWELWDMSGSRRLLSGQAKTPSKPHSNNIIGLSAGRFTVIGDTLIDLAASTAVQLGHEGQILNAKDSPSLVLIKEGDQLRLSDEL